MSRPRSRQGRPIQCPSALARQKALRAGWRKRQGGSWAHSGRPAARCWVLRLGRSVTRTTWNSREERGEHDGRWANTGDGCGRGGSGCRARPPELHSRNIYSPNLMPITGNRFQGPGSPQAPPRHPSLAFLSTASTTSLSSMASLPGACGQSGAARVKQPID